MLENVGKNNKNTNLHTIVPPVKKRQVIEEDIDELWEGGSFEG